MAWYAVAAGSVAPGSSGVATATVVQYKNAADFQAHTGFAPGSGQDPIPNPPGGFPSRAAAQAAADKFNAEPASQRQAGTLPNPNADTVVPPNLKSPVSNPLDFLRNIAVFFDKLGQANTWLRIGEFLLGAGLVIAGIAKLASGTAAGKAAGKALKAAAL